MNVTSEWLLSYVTIDRLAYAAIICMAVFLLSVLCNVMPDVMHTLARSCRAIQQWLYKE
jgi:hypothetical protein